MLFFPFDRWKDGKSVSRFASSVSGLFTFINFLVIGATSSGKFSGFLRSGISGIAEGNPSNESLLFLFFVCLINLIFGFKFARNSFNEKTNKKLLSIYFAYLLIWFILVKLVEYFYIDLVLR